MKVKEFAEQLKMEILTGEKGLEKEIKGMYICDLLSWVMSHAAKRRCVDYGAYSCQYCGSCSDGRHTLYYYSRGY